MGRMYDISRLESRVGDETSFAKINAGWSMQTLTDQTSPAMDWNGRFSSGMFCSHTPEPVQNKSEQEWLYCRAITRCKLDSTVAWHLARLELAKSLFDRSCGNKIVVVNNLTVTYMFIDRIVEIMLMISPCCLVSGRCIDFFGGNPRWHKLPANAHVGRRNWTLAGVKG